MGDLFDVPKMVSDAIASLLGALIEQAEKPLFALLGDTLLATPDVTGNPALVELWTASLATAGAVYVLFVLVGGVMLMGHETVQTRYALKQIAPRLVIGLVAAASSLTILGKAIGLANAASQAILGSTTVSGKGIAQQLIGQVLLPSGGALYGLILGLIVLALIFGVLIGYTVRVALIAVLAACAPLALSCHALPVTDGIARLWWRGIAGCLVIQLAQSTVFVVGLKLYFTPDNTIFGVPNPSQLSNLLAGLCLFWVLVKIPGWTARVIFRSTPITMPGAPMPLRILRSVAMAYVMRGAFRGMRPARTPPARPGRGSASPGPGNRPGPRPGPGGPAGRGTPGTTGPGPGTCPPSASPSIGPPAPHGPGGATPTSGGTTVQSPSPPGTSGPRGSTPPPARGVPHPAAARRRQQLTLPIPAAKTPGRPTRPVQTWLPITATRQPRASTPAPPPAAAPPPGARGRQTALPIRVERSRLRPPRPMQMRLPLEGPSTPRRRR
ncbi:hypothetical protein [Streptomyces sp. RPT161]|uniref:hypothetical protein n=1 Tax=Streptomyces sp. RPT161 TaxID=3015993 RepID=UPI0022B8C12D|nr:hypothetical protein [Streptomyces sp. RPT161]